MKKVVLCQHFFNKIGGIETFIINFCKTFYKEYDITLLCRNIDIDNALRLSQYADIICEPTDIECDTLIITSVLIDNPMIEKVKYKKIYQMVHSDWSQMKKFWDWEMKKYSPDTQFIAVSESARDSLEKEYGYDSIIIPNILIKPYVSTQKTLKLLSLCRLTREKGFERMKQLCDLLERSNIPYIWKVYGTNVYNEQSYKNMIIQKPVTENIGEIIKECDYVVQLSDTESFCYTMYESLMLGVPVLVTPFPNAKQEIKDGENGYILPFDMNISKEEIKQIYSNIPKNVKYRQEGVKEKWQELLK
jgi:glycosyltransferase involved in cell wall biosynthesis